MDDPLTALALAHRVESHEKRTKIIYITEADEQLALEQLLSAASQQQRRQQRGATGTQRGQPAAAALGGPAKQLPESVMDQLSVGYMKVEGGELRPVLLRTGGSKAKPWQRRWVTVEQLRAAIDIEYTSNAGKKAGMNSLEQRLLHKAATKLYSASGKLNRTLHGITGFTRPYLQAFLNGCPVHADRMPRKPNERPPPHPITVPRAFFQMQADECDLGADRDPWARYVLIVKELLTRHVWVRALPSKDAIHVARELYFIWMNTQAPAVLQTDNGLEFCASNVQALCDLFGVNHITSSVGHPESQGATERDNREFKDHVRALCLQMPTISWANQVLHVQKMLNNAPSTALGGMTRSEALFGAPDQTEKLPSAEAIINLLGFTNSAEAANFNAGVATTAPARVATKPVSGWRSRRGGAAGRKRSAAEAELSDLSDEEEAAAAACSSEKASPMEAELTPRPSTRRRAANGVAALVALELEGEEGATAAAAARALPPRAAAVGSPAGRRRRLTGLGVDVLADAAADAAAGAGDATSGGTAAAVAGQAAARPPATRQRRGLAAQDAAQELQAAAAAAAEPVATRQRRQQATALAGAAQQQAASVDEAAAPDEAAAGTAGPATFQLAAHHQATRARTMAAQDKRAARVAKSRGGEEPGPFAVGDAVLLWVKPNGRIGRTIDAKRLACRVVGVRTAFGHQTRYRLRCNAGVLKGNYADGVTAALPDAAAKLTFSGTATTGRGIKSGVRPVQGLKKDADIAAGRA